MFGRLIASRFAPWIIGGALALAASGWAAAGIQTIRYMSSQNALEASATQVALDANKAAAETIAALKDRHAEELRELEAELKLHRAAVSTARAENNRLTAKLERFERELEALNDEPDTHAYLSHPVPGPVLERLRGAQRRHQTGTD